MTSSKYELDNAVVGVSWLSSELGPSDSTHIVSGLELGDYFFTHEKDCLFIFEATLEEGAMILVKEVKTSTQYVTTGAQHVNKVALTRQEEMELLPFTIT